MKVTLGLLQRSKYDEGMIGSTFILNILDLLLDGDENGKAVRSQIDHLTDAKYEYTGVGLFVTFQPSEGIPIHNIVGNERLIFDGVSITSPELNVGATTILFIKDGIIDFLEIWSYDGEYPRKDLKNYTLKQDGNYASGREIIHIG